MRLLDVKCGIIQLIKPFILLATYYEGAHLIIITQTDTNDRDLLSGHRWAPSSAAAVKQTQSDEHSIAQSSVLCAGIIVTFLRAIFVCPCVPCSGFSPRAVQ